MEVARNWLVGLAILSILAVGVISVLGPAVPLEGSGDAESSTSAPTSTSAWGDATPNFVPGNVTDEHEGGKSVGWGKLTVGDVCLQEGIESELAESRLGTHGLAMDPSQRVRELADLSGYKPSELVDILLGREPGAGCGDPDCDCGHESDPDH